MTKTEDGLSHKHSLVNTAKSYKFHFSTKAVISNYCQLLRKKTERLKFLRATYHTRQKRSLGQPVPFKTTGSKKTSQDYYTESLGI